MSKHKSLYILWVLPTTLLGILIFLLGGGVPVKIKNGIWWWTVKWGLLKKFWAPKYSGMTIGHCVILVDEKELDILVSIIIAHESIHVYQDEKWGPTLKIPYLIASVIAVIKGKHYYYGNVFEEEAYNLQGEFANRAAMVLDASENVDIPNLFRRLKREGVFR